MDLLEPVRNHDGQKAGECMQSIPESQAFLSSKDGFTVFRFGDHVIRFRTSPRLERYTGIKQWDRGYLVVSAKYQSIPEEEEEYIDLIPILSNLYFDAQKALAPIRKVSIRYE